ncbi:MAG: hypothetical protein CMJ32_03505 [Phycisphaerae bacterium]|nr:hypothetical protein [Phycisphaerae bacterium]
MGSFKDTGTLGSGVLFHVDSRSRLSICSLALFSALCAMWAMKLIATTVTTSPQTMTISWVMLRLSECPPFLTTC